MAPNVYKVVVREVRNAVQVEFFEAVQLAHVPGTPSGISVVVCVPKLTATTVRK